MQNLANGLALEFECSDPTRRLRLLLSELLLVMAQVKPKRFIHCLLIQVQGWTDFYFKVNDFQNSVQLSKFLLIEATFCFQHLKKIKTHAYKYILVPPGVYYLLVFNFLKISRLYIYV